jgi:hypothetical protein
MANIKSILVDELLELTANSPKPNLDGYLDYRMFLYTLSINQLLDSIEYEKLHQCNTNSTITL